MITVLLAAWQGAAYIKEQMDSILNQTVKDIKIVISDDGSTDGTREILDRCQALYPERIFLNHRSPKRKAQDMEDGIPPAAGNFFWLLSQTEDEYIMLSDQDDVWRENKAEVLLKEIKKLETRYGKDYPILVHSDMEVVDENLNRIHPSFFSYQHCDPSRISFARILVENSVTGGAVMMNRALAEFFARRPAACFMHDWWIALTASCFGVISCVREPLYLYRQHGRNTLGAKETGSFRDVAERLSREEQVKENYRKMAAQAHAFGKMYQDEMSDEQKAVLRAYLALRYQSPAGRMKNILKNRFFKSSKLQTLAQCLTIPRPDGGT